MLCVGHLLQTQARVGEARLERVDLRAGHCSGPAPRHEHCCGFAVLQPGTVRHLLLPPSSAAFSFFSCSAGRGRWWGIERRVGGWGVGKHANLFGRVGRILLGRHGTRHLHARATQRTMQPQIKSIVLNALSSANAADWNDRSSNTTTATSNNREE